MSSTSPRNAFAVVGLVLAGGRSVRFGGEKAVAELDGRPLLLRAADRLRAVCARVAISVRKGTEAEALALKQGLPALYDAAGDAEGPLAGVAAGLRWAEELGARSLAVTPCDAPLLPEDLFERLIECAEGGAALAETSRGPEPLCAVWPVVALPAVRELLARGHPATWQVLERLGARRVSFEFPEAFANVNTRDELAQVAAQYRRQRR